MFKDFMWVCFEKTGDINAYLNFKNCIQNKKNQDNNIQENRQIM